ncbi:ACP S-malonyltransferase [Paraglaciecola sp. MB-3u-78]|jgi:[acyl-carrier-protein] S-malonyltransferase|uniref:ACP S-malonyltransferase n=1 Tax=Paraglaciecola sp. MB-3u-78 TaxID=2058332 RepID=UPI000C3339EE|nr:ACP S-malonyltransferase [Paraglaciecola sp. MB-3u-78]PKG99445.1 [acyl-carrier-protein] S-malonyltransferase [Paraglaciecola sp. MB-3u-78]
MSKQAWVFPGQGSQTLGMLSELASEYAIIQETFAQASEALGYDLWDVVQNDEQKLNQTHITQPALLAASYAIYKLLVEKELSQPVYLAGHSLGEYSALVCAGVIDFTDAVKLVEARGQFMQQAVPAGTGAMYAIIGLDDDKVVASCQQAQAETNEVVAAVNFNSPGQIVIAGNKNATDVAANLCKEHGAKRALPLAVSVPSHCALMKPAAEQLASLLKDIQFQTPKIPVINNVDVAYPNDPEAIKQALVKQLYSPVRWTETVTMLAELGVETLLEMGPSKVLTGLTKRIDKRLSCTAINTIDSVNSLI